MHLQYNLFSSYSSEDAVAEAICFDVSELTDSLDFKYPVLITHTLWKKWIEETGKQGTSDLSVKARYTLVQLLTTLRNVINAFLFINKPAFIMQANLVTLFSTDDPIYFTFTPPSTFNGVNRVRKAKVSLKALIHADAGGKTVMTLMLPQEAMKQGE